MDLTNLRALLNHKLGFYRSVQRMAREPDFEVLWGHASDSAKKEFKTHLDAFNKPRLVQWVKLETLKSQPLEHWPMSKLRPFARQFGIENYHQLRKTQLVWQIEQELNAQEKEANTPKGSGTIGSRQGKGSIPTCENPSPGEEL